MGQESHLSSSAQVCVVADSVQLSIDGRIVRVHPIRHDRAKEHGASGEEGVFVLQVDGVPAADDCSVRLRSVAGCRRSPLPRGRRPASRCSSSPVLL
jgi:hypothetical protein